MAVTAVTVLAMTGLVVIAVTGLGNDWTWQWLGLAMIGLAVTELLPVVRCRVAGV